MPRFLRALASIVPVLAALAPSPALADARPLVVIAHIDGPIFAPTRDYIARAVGRAERQNATCLLIEMDTPGGSGDAMRGIVQLFLNASTPVVVYVSPRGARAASAGAIIGLASNVLAMAPGTNIGAAHPVTGEGGNLPSDMRRKVANDMAAFARSLAEKRGRNVQWAQNVVLKSVSDSETEALKAHVADLIAPNLTDLLRQLNGRKVTTADGTHTLDTLNARTETVSLSWIEAFLLFLCNPNVAIILGAVAMYGIITEVSHPGAIVPGVVGVIAAVLSLYSLSVLTVNAAGAALILVAIALFLIDVYAPTHGVLTAGGMIAFVAGSMMLFGKPYESAELSTSVVVSIAVINALFFGTIVSAAWRSQHRPITAGGPESLIGVAAEARTDVGASGSVFVDGSLWAARNVGKEPIGKGDAVIVVARDGLRLDVRRSGDRA